jgi:hypothetical protein
MIFYAFFTVVIFVRHDTGRVF